MLRRPAQAAGGGVAGRAYALYRVLDGIEDQLKPLGVRTVTWLTTGAGRGAAHRVQPGHRGRRSPRTT